MRWIANRTSIFLWACLGLACAQTGETTGGPSERDLGYDTEEQVAEDQAVDLQLDRDDTGLDDFLPDQPTPPDGDLQRPDGPDGSSDPPVDPGESSMDSTADPSGEPDWIEDGSSPYPRPVQEGLVAGVDDSFWENMDDFVFHVLQGAPVQLYLTILDTNFYNGEAYRAWGMEILRRPESFFANAVIPLLERYSDSGVLWAIDCLNEPEALVSGVTGNWDDWGLTWSEMRDYLGYCADIVHLHSDLPVSAGSGWHHWDNLAAGRFSGLGFDFLDYHYYSDSPSLPEVSSLGVDLPVIIGEFGQSSSTWDDALQLAVARECFSQAESGGYLAALSWYYNHAGSSNHHSHLNPDGSWRDIETAFAEYASSSLITGTNLAWFSGAYDHDMGLNLRHPSWGVAYDHDVAAAMIDDLADHDIPILRFWIFEGGEALVAHTLFEDFEGGVGRWSALGEDVSLRSSALHSVDGDASLAVHLSPDSPGWYGIQASWDDQTPLNLDIAGEWRYFVFNGLDRAVGVNLAFVTRTGDTQNTYQTRYGEQGGQLWLVPGQSGTQVVSLSAESFPDKWARDNAPDQGVSRPGSEELAHVSQIRLRVYLSESQLPISGDLFVDAVRIR